MTAQCFQVPAMTSRQCVRAISARVSDVPGVRTVEARRDTRTVRVTGTADPAAVQAAIGRAGYDATPGVDAGDPEDGAADD